MGSREKEGKKLETEFRQHIQEMFLQNKKREIRNRDEGGWVLLYSFKMKATKACLKAD